MRDQRHVQERRGLFESDEDFQNLFKGQGEATTASAVAASRGMHHIAGEASADAKCSVEDGSAATMRLMSAESFERAVAVQAEHAKSALTGLAAQANRTGLLMILVGKDAAKPFEAVAPFGPGGGAGER